MGTNYYWYPEPPCPCCGRRPEPVHIGKSSGGWCFALHVYPFWVGNEPGAFAADSLEAWKHKFETEGSYIEDEYGDLVSVESLLQSITQRSARNPDFEYPDSWYEENHAVPGPRGLARRKIDGDFCVAHAPDDGTWDLCIGEFS